MTPGTRPARGTGGGEPAARPFGGAAHFPPQGREGLSRGPEPPADAELSASSA